jgi:hypothetical protein
MCNNISEAFDRARVGSILRERNVSSHMIPSPALQRRMIRG